MDKREQNRKKAMKMNNSKVYKFWETIGYVTLALCIIGQITVGKWYLLAQGAYLLANLAGVFRDFALHLPSSNKVRDIAFTAITIGLIIIFLVK